MRFTLSIARPRLVRLLLLTLLGVSVVGLTRILTRNAERDWFVAQYGQARYSEHAEELLIRDFFRDARDGFFVDVGSYDYKRFSNTYYLEQELGWSGLAIDAQKEFEAGYLKYRPRTRFFAAFVSDRSGDMESLFVPAGNRLVASSSKAFTARYEDTGIERRVPTISLNDLLDGARVTRVDFLTMDIELGEPKALAGFDIARFRPRLICVEAHPDVRQQLLDYFAARGYRLIGRYLRADPYNLWFAPSDAAIPPGVDVTHTD